MQTTKDSWVVDSQDVKDIKYAASYVARYASKGCEPDVVRDPEALREAVAALAGARMLATFGEWRGVDIERARDDATEWRSVGRIRNITADAIAGELWAIGILTQLKVTAHLDATGIVFKDIKWDTSGKDASG